MMPNQRPLSGNPFSLFPIDTGYTGTPDQQSLLSQYQSRLASPQYDKMGLQGIGGLGQGAAQPTAPTFAPIGANPNQATYNSFLPNYGSAGLMPAQSMNPANGTNQQRNMQQLPQYSGFYSQAQ